MNCPKVTRRVYKCKVMTITNSQPFSTIHPHFSEHQGIWNLQENLCLSRSIFRNNGRVQNSHSSDIWPIFQNQVNLHYLQKAYHHELFVTNKCSLHSVCTTCMEFTALHYNYLCSHVFKVFEREKKLCFLFICPMDI